MLQLPMHNCIPLPSTWAHTAWTHPVLPRLHPGSPGSHPLPLPFTQAHTTCTPPHAASTAPEESSLAPPPLLTCMHTGSNCSTERWLSQHPEKRERGNRCPISAERRRKRYEMKVRKQKKQRQECNIRSTFETS